MQHLRTRLLAVLITLSLAQHPSTAQDKPLTLNETFWPSSNFAIETDDAFQLSRWGITETLLKVDYDGNIIPHLATAWEQRSDTVWAFTLRDNVNFQNGEPFNAEAVVKAFTYLLETDTPPRGLEPESIVSVEAEGDNVVLIATTSPDVLFANRVTAPSFGILAPSAYESTPPSAFGTGTGPFELSEVVDEQSATLVRNETYWNGAVQLEQVTVLATPDADVRATMLQTGEVDLAQHLPIPLLPLLEADADITTVREAQPRTTTMYLNTKTGPLNDVRVRRAVLQAIDKDALVTAVLEGVGLAATGPFLPDAVWTNQTLQPSYDPAAAKALLEEAGYAENELTLRLWVYPTRAELPPTAVALQDMLAQIGIVVDIRVAQYEALEPSVRNGDFDMFIVSRGHLIDNYDPGGYLQADFSCEGSFNLSHYCNEEVDTLLDEAKTLADTQARYDLYKEIQDIIINRDVAGIFLFHTEQIFGYRTGIENYRSHFLEYYLLTPELTLTPQ
jgi:peptide/nickel transport system substrate-binding protein